MKKNFLLSLFMIFLSSFITFVQAQVNETLTIATYYPAPFGVYRNLRLFPIDTVEAPTCNNANPQQEGTMYYDSALDQVRVCQTVAGVLDWQNIGGGLWTQVGNNLYPNNPAWNAGIGTDVPVNKLTVTGDGIGVAQLGTAGCGGDYVGLTLGQTATASTCSNYNVLSSPTDQNLFLNRTTGNAIHFRENNATQMMVASGGNVGFGNTNPQAKVDVVGDVKLSGRIIDTGQWIRPALLNGWQNYGFGFGLAEVAYRKDALGTVEITGTIRSGQCAKPIFVLQPGYYPSVGARCFSAMSCPPSGGPPYTCTTVRVDVSPFNGEVRFPTGHSCNNQQIHLDGIRFQTN